MRRFGLAGAHNHELPRAPLLVHLGELRERLIKSLLAIAAGTLVSLAVTPQVLAALVDLAPEGVVVVALRPMEKWVVFFRVALLLGLALAMPAVIYQLVAYLLPALYPREKRTLLAMLPGASLLFITGLLFAYLGVVPRAIGFMATFLGGVAQNQWSLDAFVSFVTTMMLLVGLGFETPLVVFFLAKLRIVSPAMLRRYRRHAIVGLAVVAAALTPTPDPYTMLAVLVPMYVLYEFGILLAHLA
jgi:sec-independent protein translocase protein TatC